MLKKAYQCGQCGKVHSKKEECCGNFELEESFECNKCNMLFAEKFEHKCLMTSRRERYKENRKLREQLGKVRTRCKGCGCYIKGRHKIWCKSEEAEQIKSRTKIK